MTTKACTQASKSLRAQSQTKGQHWKRGGKTRKGEYVKAGGWGAKRMAIGCKAKANARKRHY